MGQGEAWGAEGLHRVGWGMCGGAGASASMAAGEEQPGLHSAASRSWAKYSEVFERPSGLLAATNRPGPLGWASTPAGIIGKHDRQSMPTWLAKPFCRSRLTLAI